MMFKAFSKKLFGAGYERLTRTMFTCLIVFWGLQTAGIQIRIAPFVLYLMVSTFTAGVMRQALSSEENAVNMQNMMMLPFEERTFVISYIAAMGAYTLLTKTAVLLAVLLAVSKWRWTELLGSMLCAVNAVLMTTAIFSWKKHGYASALWMAAVPAAILLCRDTSWLIPVISAGSALACLALQRADPYVFYGEADKGSAAAIRHKHQRHSVWIYFFRYLNGHKNYLMNTVIMWCAACILPLFFGQTDSRYAVPIALAILTLNTPVCILLSCDHALEQAVRFLPGQTKTFCIPYCLFISLCNITADIFFLCSWQIHLGGVTARMIYTAIFFSIQSAVLSVLLEWFYPVRAWKIESDLWHHPRKYIVPAIMLLLAGAASR